MCKQCDGEGNYNDIDGASSCKVAPVGFVVTHDHKGVTACEEGYFSDDGLTCKLCDGEGQFSDVNGASFCKTAKAGYKPTTDRKGEEQCQAGTYSTGGANECSECGDGETSSAGAAGCSTCASCAAGKYMISACTPDTETECGDCLAGTVSAGGGVTECTACTAEGEYSDTDLAR